MRISFGVGSYRSESLPVSAQRMVNAYLEEAPPQEDSPVAVPRSAGIKSFCDIDTTGEFRGAIRHARELYTVHSGNLYRVSSTGVSTPLGSIPGSERVGMTSNGGQLAISANGSLYVYESSLAQATDPDFPSISWVDYLDGYTIFGVPDTGQFGITAINDSTDYDALDFATAEAAPDDVVRGIVDHRELFLFGEDTTEVWYNSGNSDFPFERTASGFMEIGIAGRYAVGKKANSLYFLGSDAIAYRIDGYNPARISNHAIEHEFRLRAINECVVETWTERGHAFVGFRFSDAFFVYDIGTTLWSERESYQKPRWRADFVVQVYRKWYVGGYGRIGELDPDTYDELGDEQISICTSPTVSDSGKLIEHDRLELVFETGVGLNIGQGSSPLVMLEWSDDDGRTFPNSKVTSLGLMGGYKARAVFTRMGRSRNRVYRYSVSDPIKLWFQYATLNEDA